MCGTPALDDMLGKRLTSSSAAGLDEALARRWTGAKDEHVCRWPGPRAMLAASRLTSRRLLKWQSTLGV